MKCLIASEKKWNAKLASSLEQKLEMAEFKLIKRKEDFNYFAISDYGPDYIFLPHWSYQIGSDIYENFNCIIFHMTDLPYGRGGSPLQNLIVRGKKETVISALRATQKIDTGPIYLKKPLDLSGSAEEIFFRANKVIEKMIEEILLEKPSPQPQMEGEYETFKRRTPEMSEITPEMDVDQLYDHIRMLDAEGYPRAFMDTSQAKMEFSSVKRTGENVLEARVTIRPKAANP